MSYYDTRPSDHSIQSDDTRIWATIMHISFLSGISILPGFGFFLAPFLVYMLGKQDRPELAHHFNEVMNFAITWIGVPFVLGILGFLFILATIGLGAIIVVPISWIFGILVLGVTIICPILGAVSAYQGERFRYPMTLRFL